MACIFLCKVFSLNYFFNDLFYFIALSFHIGDAKYTAWLSSVSSFISNFLDLWDLSCLSLLRYPFPTDSVCSGMRCYCIASTIFEISKLLFKASGKVSPARGAVFPLFCLCACQTTLFCCSLADLMWGETTRDGLAGSGPWRLLWCRHVPSASSVPRQPLPFLGMLSWC